MDINEIVKKHIVLAVALYMAGIISVIISVLLGYFGFTVIALIGLAACSSAFLLLLPFLLNKKKDKR